MLTQGETVSSIPTVGQIGQLCGLSASSASDGFPRQTCGTYLLPSPLVSGSDTLLKVFWLLAGWHGN